jgi:hypothetical protein
MKPGDILQVRRKGGLWPLEVTVIDDCFRLTESATTALVRVNDDPSVEFEVNINDLYRENHRGKDL